MNEKIRMHVNGLFENAPNNKRVNDLKDEIVSNANDKYQDFIAEGKTEEEAYRIVIGEIGNVEELLEELNKNNPINKENYDLTRRKTARVVATAVGLYILAVLTTAMSDELNLPEFVQIASFFTLGGIATCILIYYFMSKPKYAKYEDTMVEEFKEWKGKKDSNKEIRKAISSIIWTLTIIFYLVISFTFGIWHISWIIFIMGTLVENIVNLIFKLGEK